MVELNPVLLGLEPDIEGLIVNRLAEPPVYVIAPIDRCYALTGTIKASWEGISGGGARRGGGGGVLRAAARRGGAAHERSTSCRDDGGAAPGERARDPRARLRGARRAPVRYAAAPMLVLDLQVSEPSGRPVYMIALTIQLMIEPARRRYDDATREQLIELFGTPERWSVTTRSLVWCQLDVLVPAFTGIHGRDRADRVQLRPGARRRQVPALAARRRGAAGAALQRHDLLPGRRRRPADGARAVDQVDRLPDAGVGVARDGRALLPQHRLGRAAHRDARGAAAGEAGSRAGDAGRLRADIARGDVGRAGGQRATGEGSAVHEARDD